MNYITEINAFEQWLETHYLPISSQLLWYKLMSVCNRAGWSEWVTVDNLRLMAAMQMSREATLIKARDELIKAGLIEYKKGRKGSPNKYHMIPFTVVCTCKSEVKNVVQTVVQSAVESEVKNVVQSADIYKLKQNNKKKDTNVSKEKKASAASTRFTPPTVEEVQAYCLERGNKVNAEQFVDFYAAKGWMIGKQKMKDWRACVRTWEKNDFGSGKSAPKKVSFDNFEQRNTDYDALVAQHYGYGGGGNERI